jgi:hypothetical protein
MMLYSSSSGIEDQRAKLADGAPSTVQKDKYGA